MKLTKEEIALLEAWLEQEGVGNIALDPPVVRSVADTGRGEVEGVLGGYRKLSESTRRAYNRKAAQRAAIKRRNKGRKLPKGQYHHKRKEATKRRAKEKRWKEQPLKSLSYSWGNWRISQEDWDRCVGHLWVLYNPLLLSVKRKWGKGTKKDPYTVYDIDVYYKEEKVYSGQEQFIYDSSMPNALDIEKAPSGAWLFTEGFMSLYSLKKNITKSKLLALFS